MRQTEAEIWMAADPAWARELPPTTGHLDMMESGSLWWMHPPALLSVPQWTFPTKTFNKPLVHFAKKNKFQYLAGAALEPAGGSYVYQIPAVAMPYIMTSNPSLPISKIPENIFVPNMQRRWLPMPPVYPTTV